jgi:hypothetical protein
MIDVASDNTSLISAQLIIEFLGRIVEHPGYRKRHPFRAGAAPSTDGGRPRAASAGNGRTVTARPRTRRGR